MTSRTDDHPTDTPSNDGLADAFAREPREILAALDVDPDTGLSGSEASRRLEEHGPNKLPEPEKDSAVKRFLLQFNDVLIYVLLAAAVLTALLQQWTDMIVILLVVVINAVIGFVQEGKAEQALEGIKNMLSASANVRRDGRWETVEAEDVVVGDIVRLSAGDRIPADVRLLEVNEMAAEESALTGESEPARKSADAVEADAGLGDRTSMGFSSTTLTSGTATGVVVGAGEDTEIGRINTMMTEVESLETPLTRQIDAFAKKLALVVLVLTVVLVAVGYFLHDFPLVELLLSAVGFAVAAVPEGLPALITITLALGVRRMAESKAITRKLASVQTLGSVTTICTDKTGTLTTNEMTVKRVVVAGREYDVEGHGYAPEGAVTREGEQAGLDDTGLRHLVGVMSTANDTDLFRDDEDGDGNGGGWAISGEPTEGALKSLAGKLDFDDGVVERLATLPFSSDNKLMAVTGRLGDDDTRVLVKGAPDRLLDRATSQLTADGGTEPLDREEWEATIDRLSAQGLRVLAAADRRAAESDADSLGLDDLGEELVLVGVVGIVDPPRPEAVDAIGACRAAGIEVTMITGDHAGTAEAIAREMGIDTGSGAVTGKEIEEASDEELRAIARDHHVFARTSPEHKLRLVQALQEEGEVVAMTGDGVNDAPALRRADVGVAMGIKGTEVTKESAELVLADDNFATIETAVEQGRRIYDNIRKALVFLLPSNGAQATVVLVAVLLGWTLPLTPLQVLWVNMVTAVTLAFAFAFEPAEDGIMQRAPRGQDEGLVGWRNIVQIAVVSLLIAGATIAAFAWRLDAGDDLAVARTMATTVLVVCQVFYLFNVKALESTSLRPSVLVNNRVAWLVVAVLIALQAAFIYLGPLQSLFGSTALDARYIGVAALIGLGVFLVTEVLKLALYRRARTASEERWTASEERTAPERTAPSEA